MINPVFDIQLCADILIKKAIMCILYRMWVQKRIHFFVIIIHLFPLYLIVYSRTYNTAFMSLA